MLADLLIFLPAAIAVLVLGGPLARVVEALADRLGLGQVIVGAILLGVMTSLPGLVLTISAAARGDSELAVSNVLGGVAAQTAFVALADVAYRQRTLSSGVPTRQVALQSALLVVLLSLVIVGLGTSDASLGPIHLVSLAMIVAYALGLRAGRDLGEETVDADAPRSAGEMGEEHARREGERAGIRGKVGDVGAPSSEERALSTVALWGRFALLASALAGAGFGLSVAGQGLADSTALSSASVGFVFTSVATSTPELVTAIAAARRGAIGLAAGDIIGGNVFDTLFIAGADIVSGGGAFTGAGPNAVVLAGLAMLMNGMLLSGLMRQGRGARDVDLESFAIVGVWLVGVVVLVV